MAKADFCARPGDVIIVFGPGYWGKGDTYKEALREYSKTTEHWRTDAHHVYSVPPDAWVSEDGCMRWTRPRKANGRFDEDYDILILGTVAARKGRVRL